MPTIFIGLLALALVLWLAKSFARADPKYLIRVGRTAGGIVALAGAAFLGVRGQLAVAVPLGVTGLGLLGWLPTGCVPDSGGATRKAPAKLRRSVPISSPSSWITIPAPCPARSSPDASPAPSSISSSSARWFRFSASSTRKAATYWQRILTAGIPDGVKTRRAMRQRGTARRDPAK